MPLLIPAIIGALIQICASLVGRVLLALCISYVTFKGFDALFSYAKDLAKANVNSLPGDIYSFVTWLWVDKAINLITSAYTAALVIKMAGSTSISKMVVKK